MNNDFKFNDSKLISLLDRIVELFFETGIRNLNMDDISSHLKISKKTLYQYFKSKEDLIEQIFAYEFYKWDNKISEIKINEINAIDILIQVSIFVYDEMSRLNPKLKFEIKKYYEPIFNRFMIEKQNQIFSQLSKNMEKGKTEGLYREDLDIELTARLYIRNLLDLHSKDYCFGEQISFNQIFEVMFENHIRAISTPEGLAYFEKRKSELSHLHKNIN
jgi:AcrR family transcriptional regulator